MNKKYNAQPQRFEPNIPNKLCSTAEKYLYYTVFKETFSIEMIVLSKKIIHWQWNRNRAHLEKENTMNAFVIDATKLAR